MSETFISVGENIHCTRVYKTDGKFVTQCGDGYALTYQLDGKLCYLPIPQVFQQHSDWADGKVKHCAVAIHQGVYGNSSFL